MKNHFQKNFKKLRKKIGRTQQGIANDLLVSQKAVGAWEEGRAKPGFDTLINIAGIFGVTIDQILKEEL